MRTPVIHLRITSTQDCIKYELSRNLASSGKHRIRLLRCDSSPYLRKPTAFNSTTTFHFTHICWAWGKNCPLRLSSKKSSLFLSNYFSKNRPLRSQTKTVAYFWRRPTTVNNMTPKPEVRTKVRCTNVVHDLIQISIANSRFSTMTSSLSLTNCLDSRKLCPNRLGYYAISGWRLMSHLGLRFFGVASVQKNCSLAARITIGVILTSEVFGDTSQYL